MFQQTINEILAIIERMVRLQYAPRCGHSMPNTKMGMLVFPDYTQDNDLWIHLHLHVGQIHELIE